MSTSPSMLLSIAETWLRDRLETPESKIERENEKKRAWTGHDSELDDMENAGTRLLIDS